MTPSSESQEPVDELPPYLVPHSQAPIRIVYEDRDLLLVDKPHHLLSVPGRHPLNHDSLIRRLQPRYPDVQAVHRLDLDTSGLMVVPKRRESLSELGRQFQRRQIEKEYTAIVWGEMEDDGGAIELPIATDWPNRPKQMVCEERGKHALTRFEVLNRGDNRSLVKLMPVTGRSHQLRIHMQSLGHPIIGCDMYAHPEALEASDRLLLHATRLKLCAPSTGNWLSAFSPIPFAL
ncbi:MAG: RluA family pseudouridine synthase [Gammaproteobacteria bacterium]|nr:RluA family pseudouridine synthase [Gammaproteobacteria bacterium]